MRALIPHMWECPFHIANTASISVKGMRGRLREPPVTRSRTAHIGRMPGGGHCCRHGRSPLPAAIRRARLGRTQWPGIMKTHSAAPLPPQRASRPETCPLAAGSGCAPPVLCRPGLSPHAPTSCATAAGAACSPPDPAVKCLTMRDVSQSTGDMLSPRAQNLLKLLTRQVLPSWHLQGTQYGRAGLGCERPALCRPMWQHFQTLA